MASSSFAGTNQPLSSSSSRPARRLGQFPPVPKSVRVVSVFSEPQPSPTLDSPATLKPESHSGLAWALWLLGFTVILSLILAAIFGASFWNQLPI
jgi:hypothetical protein